MLQHHAKKGDPVGSQQQPPLGAVAGNEEGELDGLIEAWDLEEIRREQHVDPELQKGGTPATK